MPRTITLPMRGAMADNPQAIQDAYAVTLLRQPIRDAAGAVAAARRQLAVAMAYHTAATEAVRRATASNSRAMRPRTVSNKFYAPARFAF